MRESSLGPASSKVSTVTEAFRHVYERAGAFFLVLSVAMALFLGYRASRLWLLYTDASVRASVQSSLNAVSDNWGWLVSDIQVKAVFSDHVRIVHRAHARGRDATRCVDVFFDSDFLVPCAD